MLEVGDTAAPALTRHAGTATGSMAELLWAAFLLFAFQPGLEATGYLQCLFPVLHEHGK